MIYWVRYLLGKDSDAYMMCTMPYPCPSSSSHSPSYSLLNLSLVNLLDIFRVLRAASHKKNERAKERKRHSQR